MVNGSNFKYAMYQKDVYLTPDNTTKIGTAV